MRLAVVDDNPRDREELLRWLKTALNQRRKPVEYLAFAHGEIKFTTKPLYIYNLNSVEGTVGSSSLYWRNWQKSLDFVKSWVERNSEAHTTTVLERERLQRLEQRWRVSHALAVGRSHLGFFAKCKLLNVFWVIPATVVAKIRK